MWWKSSAVVPWPSQLHALIRGGDSQQSALIRGGRRLLVVHGLFVCGTHSLVSTGVPWSTCVWDSFISTLNCHRYVVEGVLVFHEIFVCGTDSFLTHSFQHWTVITSKGDSTSYSCPDSSCERKRTWLLWCGELEHNREIKIGKWLPWVKLHLWTRCKHWGPPEQLLTGVHSKSKINVYMNTKFKIFWTKSSLLKRRRPPWLTSLLFLSWPLYWVLIPHC